MTNEEFDKEILKRFGKQLQQGKHIEIHNGKNGLTYFSVQKTITRKCLADNIDSAYAERSRGERA